ncbi:LOW QUALITY PROTEIN: PiggyBac transposable element-derived protein 4 [Elysia marginata]|uniref:PiggyBac transposable element-derived protein 4 n=1 Tax=Elysia marginata TaxID=1093978 RepID=A0AAV4ITL3_9GAST|nr:LOW QUALITY PROTEIN: PiggyBac transposable element-derived protein 4 [Elysia marginata]
MTPLHKIRPLYDHLRKKFSSVYRPAQNICIDEALCPWRGRSHMRVYMEDKTVKWGIKLNQLCESGSGYVWDFKIMAHIPGLSPYDICHRLISPLTHVGHCLYIDNFYCKCNPALCDSLAAVDTMVVGTVRSNRIDLPKDLIQQPMNRGDMDYRRRNQLLALWWKDKRDVHLLTTKHTPTMQEHTSRTETKLKPTAVIDYTNNMSGVDLNDQLMSYMPFHRKTVKWWKKVALHLLTLCFVQAHILHNKHRKQHRLRKWKLEKFVRTLCLNIAQKGQHAEREP